MLLNEEGAKSRAFLVASYNVPGSCPLTQPRKGSESPSINNTTNLLSEISVTNTANLWNSLIYVSTDPHCLSCANSLNYNLRSLVSNLSMSFPVNSS